MSEQTANRHKADNEAIFRELNQSLQKGIDEANAIAAEEGQAPLEFDANAPVLFFCECADENCLTRISMSPRAYNEIHQNKRRFIIAPDHEVDEIENVTQKEAEYWVVTKYEEPPQLSDTLHPTDVNNS